MRNLAHCDEKIITCNVFISGLALLSFLPESSFCFIRGNCRKRFGANFGDGKFYEHYTQHWKQQREQRRRQEESEQQEQFDYYNYEEPEINKRQGLEARRPKRESAEGEDIYYDDTAALPAEHRQLTPAQSRQRKNPM